MLIIMEDDMDPLLLINQLKNNLEIFQTLFKNITDEQN